MEAAEKKAGKTVDKTNKIGRIIVYDTPYRRIIDKKPKPMHSPSITIPHDALLVLSRAKNSGLYGRVIDKVARGKARLHMCNGINFRDRYLDTDEVRGVIDDRSARVLALVIDTEWSNSIKENPLGHKAKPPFDFPNRPEVYHDRSGPTQLMDEVRTRHPDITQILVTDTTIAEKLEGYFHSLV